MENLVPLTGESLSQAASWNPDDVSFEITWDIAEKRALYTVDGHAVPADVYRDALLTFQTGVHKELFGILSNLNCGRLDPEGDD